MISRPNIDPNRLPLDLMTMRTRCWSSLRERNKRVQVRFWVVGPQVQALILQIRIWIGPKDVEDKGANSLPGSIVFARKRPFGEKFDAYEALVAVGVGGDTLNK